MNFPMILLAFVTRADDGEGAIYIGVEKLL
jgi:hypothetical protein